MFFETFSNEAAPREPAGPNDFSHIVILHNFSILKAHCGLHIAALYKPQVKEFQFFFWCPDIIILEEAFFSCIASKLGCQKSV